jgi:hypothetical protein
MQPLDRFGLLRDIPTGTIWMSMTPKWTCCQIKLHQLRWKLHQKGERVNPSTASTRYTTGSSGEDVLEAALEACRQTRESRRESMGYGPKTSSIEEGGRRVASYKGYMTELRSKTYRPSPVKTGANTESRWQNSDHWAFPP